MNFVNPRNAPRELIMLQHLNGRMSLPENSIKIMHSRKKGLEGERHFDSMLKELEIDCLILRDLLFDINNEHFQIDTLLILHSTIYLFEVKNYSGEYYIINGKWKNPANVKDPTLQLRRSETLFRQLLSSLQLPLLDIKPLVVFPHPEFTLFQASKDLPIILPNQIPKFIRKLNKNTDLKLNKQNHRLSEELLSNNLPTSPYTRMPEYHYAELVKGITCPKCFSLMILNSRRRLSCPSCLQAENLNYGVLRSIEEFRLLFPNKKLSTATIFEWCGGIASKKVIRKVLSTQFQKKGAGRQTYYINFPLENNTPRELIIHP